MANNYSLFIGKNDDGWHDFQIKYDLPGSDHSKFVDGFLETKISNIKSIGGYLSKGEIDNLLREFDEKYKWAVKSPYIKGGTILDSGETEPWPGNIFEFLETGYYYIQMASAGGRGADSPIYTERFYKDEDDYIEFWKQNRRDTNKVKKNLGTEEVYYTWERRRDIIKGYTTIWRGTYSYLNNTIYLSLVDLAYLDKTTGEEESSGFSPDYEKEYGILMIKKDILSEGGEKLKLFAFRSDDLDEDIYSKYENGSIIGNEFVPSPSTLIETIISPFYYVTPDLKGGDGQFYNESMGITAGKINFFIGSNGDDSIIMSENLRITVPGGTSTSKKNNFGGRGGGFIYDYYQRIYYHDDPDRKRPENGYLKIIYFGSSALRNLTVIKDDRITEISVPGSSISGTLIILKTLIPDIAYEIDFEKSTIKGDNSLVEEQSLKNYRYGKIGTTITEPDYYSVQTITLPMPNENIVINLKTKKVKFKITYINDSGGVVNCKLQEKVVVGSFAESFAEFGDDISLNLEYNDGYFISELIFAHYLAMKDEDITFHKRSGIGKQLITFKMPKRNIIIKVKCDYLLLLTFQLNERQRIEEETERQDGRKIESVQVRYFSDIEGRVSDIRSITNFPDITRVRPKTIFDVYVKYYDNKMTLDKTNIWSQYQSTLIEETGNFSGVSFLNPDTDGIKIPPPQQVLPDNIISTTREYYQHFRFVMPFHNLFFDLKWMERLYLLTVEMMELLSTGSQRNSTLSRSVYPYAVSGGNIPIEITLINEHGELIEYPTTYVQLYESMNPELNKDIRSSDAKKLIGEEFDISINEKSLSLDGLLMPKRNLKFFLGVKY